MRNIKVKTIGYDKFLEFVEKATAVYDFLQTSGFSLGVWDEDYGWIEQTYNSPDEILEHHFGIDFDASDFRNRTILKREV